MRILWLAFIAALMTGCTDPKKANEALDNLGFTEIEITGFEWWGCGQDDMFSTGFKAINPKGKHVQGTVCSGQLKGTTVRF